MTDKRRFSISKIFSYLFLFCAALFVMYYLWSAYFIGEYDHDVAEMVMWADSVAETGKLGNPDFAYSYFLPFGGHLFIVPFIRILGPGIHAHRCGMTIYSIIFIALIFLFLRSIFNSSSKAAYFTGIMIFCLCSVKRLRLLFWTHTIFYSLSVFFYLGAFILLYIYKQDRKNKNLILLLLFIWLMIGSSENITFLILFIFPFLLAFISEILLSGKLSDVFKRENIVFLVVAVFATLMGRILYHFLAREVTTVYGEHFPFLMTETNWFSNIPITLKCWFLLFNKLQDVEASVYTPDGWFLAIRLVFSLFVLFVSLFSFREYSKFNYLEKVFCCFHYFLSFFILFFYVFGKMSDAEWRLSPIYFTSIMMTIIVCYKNLPGKIVDYTFRELLPSVLMLLYSLCCGLSLIMSPKDVSAYYGDFGIISILRKKDLKFGYTIPYHDYGNSISVLSNGSIKSLSLEYIPETNSFIPSPYNISNKAYTNRKSTDPCFLIVNEEYYLKNPQIGESAVSVIPAKGKCDMVNNSERNSKNINMIILVFENDILQKK